MSFTSYYGCQKRLDTRTQERAGAKAPLVSLSSKILTSSGEQDSVRYTEILAYLQRKASDVFTPMCVAGDH
ncbi:MAG: hypothetical protein DMG64_05170 [Acidobacteria bacterium]|nr:MAG: hypothetical protein DMG64_05170 [Acidobacteriota bacterium]PYY24358.1 MAG: hypothetical protein DMG62_03450 [Acidobacteriota bacterium]